MGVGWSRAVAAFGLPSREARCGFGPRASLSASQFSRPNEVGTNSIDPDCKQSGTRRAKKEKSARQAHSPSKRIYMAMHALGQSLRGACSQRMPSGMSIEATAAFLGKKTTQRSQEFSSGKSGKKRSARRPLGARPTALPRGQPCASCAVAAPASALRPYAHAWTCSFALSRSSGTFIVSAGERPWLEPGMKKRFGPLFAPPSRTSHLRRAERGRSLLC